MAHRSGLSHEGGPIHRPILLSLLMAAVIALGATTSAFAQQVNAPTPLTPAPMPTSAPASPVPSLGALAVRAADHGTYDRLVFDWPEAVGYTVQQSGDRFTVTPYFKREGDAEKR